MEVKGGTHMTEFDNCLPAPTPLQLYRPGLFRLAGYGGGLVMLRSGVADDPARLTLDVGFLTRTDYVWAMRRTMTEGLSTQLSGFFFACASELHPENAVAPVLDDEAGLSVWVLSSTDDRAELEFSVGDEGLNMQTSRVALALAAEEVLGLEAPGTSRYFDEQNEDR